jgi:hypothetical protein
MKNPMRWLFVFSLCLLASVRPADARIIRIDITRTESPTFGGATFGDRGQYEKLTGRAFGEIDPADPRNRIIVDVDLAPRNQRGMIEYSTDVIIFRPIDRSKANRRLFYEINNRGAIRSLGLLNDVATVSNDPSAAADAGNGFLMRQGYTILVSGWDATVVPGGGRLTIRVPVARQRNGEPVIGPALEEFVIDNNTTQTAPLTYPAVSLNRSGAVLTLRSRYADTPATVTNWEYVHDRAIRLIPEGTRFEQGRLYEFVYNAKDPLVAGIAFAATRDLAAAAHTDNAAADVFGGRVEQVYSFCVSQPCRFMRDFVHLGFNEDEHGRRAFDGILNWVGGASGGFFNYRFAQPGATHRQHIGRWFPERLFPFANQVITDAITGATDGRLGRCLASNTCPKIFEVNSANEYWVKGGSLLHTDTRGNDLPDPPNVRFYFFSSFPHSSREAAGFCQQPGNPVLPNPGLRALLVALDQWTAGGTEPPPSRLPRVADRTLVPVAQVNFPRIPGVRFSGVMTTGDLFDYGGELQSGVLTVLPPKPLGSPYPVLVPQTDADGNDVAGIRFPDIAVPLATYTGWSVRQPAFGGDDLCDANGQRIAFAATRAERLSAGDPRLSIKERYPTSDAYVRAVLQSAAMLRNERLLLEEDVDRIVERAKRASPAVTGVF